MSLPEQLQLSNRSILPDKTPDLFEESENLLEIFCCNIWNTAADTEKVIKNEISVL